MSDPERPEGEPSVLSDDLILDTTTPVTFEVDGQEREGQITGYLSEDDTYSIITGETGQHFIIPRATIHEMNQDEVARQREAFLPQAPRDVEVADLQRISEIAAERIGLEPGQTVLITPSSSFLERIDEELADLYSPPMPSPERGVYQGVDINGNYLFAAASDPDGDSHVLTKDEFNRIVPPGIYSSAPDFKVGEDACWTIAQTTHYQFGITRSGALRYHRLPDHFGATELDDLEFDDPLEYDNPEAIDVGSEQESVPGWLSADQARQIKEISDFVDHTQGADGAALEEELDWEIPAGTIEGLVNKIVELRRVHDFRRDLIKRGEAKPSAPALAKFKEQDVHLSKDVTALAAICQSLGPAQRAELLAVIEAQDYIASQDDEEAGLSKEEIKKRQERREDVARAEMEIIGPIKEGISLGEDVYIITAEDIETWARTAAPKDDRHELEELGDDVFTLTPDGYAQKNQSASESEQGRRPVYPSKKAQLVSVRYVRESDDPELEVVLKNRPSGNLEQKYTEERALHAEISRRIRADIEALQQKRADAVKGTNTAPEPVTLSEIESIRTDHMRLAEPKSEVIPLAQFLQEAVPVKAEQGERVKIMGLSGEAELCRKLGEVNGRVVGLSLTTGQILAGTALVEVSPKTDKPKKPGLLERARQRRQEQVERSERAPATEEPSRNATRAGDVAVEVTGPITNDDLPIYFKRAMEDLGVNIDELSALETEAAKIEYLSELGLANSSETAEGGVQVDASVVRLIDTLSADATMHVGGENLLRLTKVAEDMPEVHFRRFFNYRNHLKRGPLRSLIDRLATVSGMGTARELYDEKALAWTVPPEGSGTNDFEVWVTTQATDVELLDRLAQARLFLSRHEERHETNRRGVPVGTWNRLAGDTYLMGYYKLLVRETIRRCGPLDVAVVVAASETPASASPTANRIDAEQVGSALAANSSHEEMERVVALGQKIGALSFAVGERMAVALLRRQINRVMRDSKPVVETAVEAEESPAEEQNESPPYLTADRIEREAERWVEGSPPFNSEMERELAAHFIREAVASRLGLLKKYNAQSATTEIDEDDWRTLPAVEPGTPTVQVLKEPNQNGLDLSYIKLVDGQFDFGGLQAFLEPGPTGADRRVYLIEIAQKLTEIPWGTFRAERELQTLSDNKIAQLCGVDVHLLDNEPYARALRRKVEQVIWQKFDNPGSTMKTEFGPPHPFDTHSDIASDNGVRAYLKEFAREEAAKQGIELPSD